MNNIPRQTRTTDAVCDHVAAVREFISMIPARLQNPKQAAFYEHQRAIMIDDLDWHMRGITIATAGANGFEWEATGSVPPRS